MIDLPGGLVVRIRRSHRRGRGSIPRLGMDILLTLLVNHDQNIEIGYK